MASVKWKCCLPHSNSDGSAATYGNRCVSSPDGEYDTQEDCETFCLHPEWEVARIDDIYMTAHNVIQFVYDRGMKFPVPRGFLEKIATRQRNDFYQIVRMEDKFYNIVRGDTDNFQQIVLDVLGKTRKVATYKMDTINGKKSILNLGVIRKIQTHIENGSADIFYIYLGVNRSGDDMNHANSIIIDSKYKKIIRLEPHQKYYDDVKGIKIIFSNFLDEGYEYYENSVCPRGFQSKDTILGGACATWAEFMAIWVALNPERNIREILDYATGSKSADSLLLLYIYYGKIRYPKVRILDTGYTEIVILNRRLVTLIRDDRYNIDFIQDTLIQINNIIFQIHLKVNNNQSITIEESYFSAHVIVLIPKIENYINHLRDSDEPSTFVKASMIYDCFCIFYGDYINMAPVLSADNLATLKLYYIAVSKRHDLQINKYYITIEPEIDTLINKWIDFGSREARARVQRFLRRISQLYKEPGSTQQSVYQELLGSLNMDKQMRRKAGEK